MRLTIGSFFAMVTAIAICCNLDWTLSAPTPDGCFILVDGFSCADENGPRPLDMGCGGCDNNHNCNSYFHQISMPAADWSTKEKDIEFSGQGYYLSELGNGTLQCIESGTCEEQCAPNQATNPPIYYCVINWNSPSTINRSYEISGPTCDFWSR